MANENCELVMMVTPKSFPLCKKTVQYILKNIRPREVVLVGSNKVKDLIDFECTFINEDELYPGLTYKGVEKILVERIGNGKLAGWYLQQFLKMAYAYECKGKAYIVWDSDTIPLRKLDYFDNGLFKFFTKTEYHKPYFETIDKLLSNKVKRWDEKISFISENMIFDVSIMKSLIKDIETNVHCGGAFWEKILNTIDLKDLGFSGFSEFETYGNYVMEYFAKYYKISNFKSFRYGNRYFGGIIDDEVLEWVSKDYDTISFESWDIYRNNFWNRNIRIIKKFISFRMFKKLSK